MITAKNLILSRLIKPDIDITNLSAEDIALLKIIDKATGGGVVPVYDADITNGIASFNGVTRSKPLVSLLLNIPVTQTGSGTPSPDNIRDFIPVSGVNVSRTGKNLVDLPDIHVTSQQFSSWFSFKAGRYTLSIHAKNNNVVVGYYRVYKKISDGNSLVSEINIPANIEDELSVTFNLSEDSDIRLVAQGSTAGYDYEISNIQLELGSSPTAYEPYTGNIYTISFGQSVYSAILDVLRGKLSITHGIVDLGDLEWNKYGTDKFYNTISDLKLPTTVAERKQGMWCSIYKPSTGYSLGNMSDKSFLKFNQNENFWIYDSDYTDATAFKTAMNGINLVYELATPIEIQLTPTVINTLIGENVIFADVGDITECKYTRK